MGSFIGTIRLFVLLYGLCFLTYNVLEISSSVCEEKNAYSLPTHAFMAFAYLHRKEALKSEIFSLA